MDNYFHTKPKRGSQIIPADPNARAFTLGISLTILFLGALALWWLKGYEKQLVDLAEVDRPAAIAKTLQLVDIVVVAGGIGLVAAGIWFGALGHRTVKSGRFPPPGMRVIRDTSVRTGARAHVTATVIFLIAALLVAMGTAGMWVFRSIAHSLLGR